MRGSKGQFQQPKSQSKMSNYGQVNLEQHDTREGQNSRNFENCYRLKEPGPSRGGTLVERNYGQASILRGNKKGGKQYLPQDNIEQKSNHIQELNS
jgi:hypothetical protein